MGSKKFLFLGVNGEVDHSSNWEFVLLANKKRYPEEGMISAQSREGFLDEIKGYVHTSCSWCSIVRI